MIWAREISLGFSMEISIDSRKKIFLGFSMAISIDSGKRNLPYNFNKNFYWFGVREICLGFSMEISIDFKETKA